MVIDNLCVARCRSKHYIGYLAHINIKVKWSMPQYGA